MIALQPHYKVQYRQVITISVQTLQYITTGGMRASHASLPLSLSLSLSLPLSLSLLWVSRDDIPVGSKQGRCDRLLVHK